ncbi:MAG: type II 3-dehydroquinate dehydratase [Omnitrophica bacterium RIFOXYB12_FULL_50_7]|nr:MAG: type II 3-dehydroquinate dehydratase [Omnitrophica bacterium RIFOXYB12_FULL_50_7]
MRKILVIHGPNLQLLGEREVSVYGKVTLKQINEALVNEAAVLGVEVEILQSNHEGEIVDRIGAARLKFSGILINPAAYTHTSVAIRDALAACGLLAVEVHLSHIYKREDFRQHSMTAPACVAQVTGFGKNSYLLGLRGLVAFASKANSVHSSKKPVKKALIARKRK